MAERLKIAVCTDGIFPNQVGGMQRHSRLLVEHLAKAEDISEIVVFHPHQEKLFSSLKIKEIFLDPIDHEKNYLKECYSYSKRMHAQLLKLPHHLIYAQGLSVWYGVSDFSSRLIINPHGLEPFQAIGIRDKFISIPFKIIFRYLFRRSARVVSLGGRLNDILGKMVPSSKIVFLPNATLLPSKMDKISNGEVVRCFFLARFAHNKGIHILLQAIHELNAEGFGKKLEFYLGGKGPLWQSIHDSLLPDNVKLLGFIDEEQLGLIFRNSDLFVFPTLFEGMPTVVLEAMAHELPVVSTDVGAVRELVNEDNGFLIAPDSVPQLKKALLDFLILSDIQKEELGKCSFAKVQNQFTWDRVADLHVRAFRELRTE